MRSNWLKFTKGTCKIFLILTGLLMVPFLNAQTINISSTETGGVYGYGDIILIDTIYIVELNDSAFGNTDEFNSNNPGPAEEASIFIEPVPGYTFGGYATKNHASGGDIAEVQDPVFSSGNISILFSTVDTTSLDSIFILGARLIPTPGAGTWSGNIDVTVDTAGGSSPVRTASFGNFSMVQPAINLTYNSEMCENQAFNIDIDIIDNATTYTDEDTLIVEYLRELNNYTDSIIDSIPLGSGQAYNFIQDSLYSDYNAIRVKVNYGNGWFLQDSITISNSAGSDILRGTTPTVTLLGEAAANNGTVSKSVLSSYVNISAYFTHTGDTLLVDTTPDYLYYNGIDYIFNPLRAGQGFHYIDIIAVSQTAPYCQDVQVLAMNVMPDIITLKKAYCYGYDTQGTVKVAGNAIKGAYTDVYTSGDREMTVTKNISFHSLTLNYQGEDVHTFQLSDTVVGNPDGFWKFEFNPTQLMEQNLGRVPVDGESIDIIFKLYMQQTVTTVANLHVDWIEYIGIQDLEEEGWLCEHRYPYRSDDWFCFRTVTMEDVSLLNMESELTSIVTPLNDGYFVEFDQSYCQNSDSIRFIPSNTVDTIFSSLKDNNVAKRGNDYYLYPSEFNPDSNTVDTINYYFFDRNGCPGDSVFYPIVQAVPKATFIADSICEGEPQLFTQYSPDSNQVDIIKRDWIFGDGFRITNFLIDSENIEPGTHGGGTFGTYQSPGHFYNDGPGIKEVILGVMSDKGCINYDTTEIIIGKYPTPGLTFAGKLEGRTTTLTNLSSTFAEDPVNLFEFTITNPLSQVQVDTLNTYEPYDFISDQPGVYHINLLAETRNGCIRETDTLIPIFPIQSVLDDELYFENFNDNIIPSGWLASHEFLPDITSGWKNVPIAGIFNDGDKQTSGNIWLTGDPNDSIIKEKGWLESPCYDISELHFPMVSMDIFQSLEPGRDGAVVLYSIDDGITWSRLGSGTSGTNWYNTIGIFSNPGGTVTENIGTQGWSVDVDEWQLVRHSLDAIKTEIENNPGTGCVRFRIAYNSNEYTESIYAGLGVDNFLVGKRERIVLVEEFINSNYPDDNFTDITLLDYFVDNKPLEIVDIRYHMSTNNVEDEIYTQLYWWQDHNSRASEYAANTWGPMWVMDGVVKNRNSVGYIDGVTYERALEERALVDPEFSISDAQLTVDGTSLNITTTVRKISNHIEEKYGPHACQVRMAIVQKEFTDRNGKLHKNVLVDLLPDKEGNVVHTIPAGSEIGYEVVINETWNPGIITVGNEYRLVIYVQGEMHIDEVQQVWFRDLLDTETPQSTSGIESNLTNSFNVFPNPARNNLNIVLGNYDIGEGAIWSITSMSGQLIKQGEIFNGENISVVPVEELSQGIYLIHLYTRDGEQIIRKFTKIAD